MFMAAWLIARRSLKSENQSSRNHGREIEWSWRDSDVKSRTPLAAILPMVLVVFVNQPLATAAPTHEPGLPKKTSVPIDEIQPLNTEQLEAIEALEWLDPHLEFSPDDLVSRRSRAEYLAILERYEAAIQDLELVLEEDPDDAEVRSLLLYCYRDTAYALYLTNRPEEAFDLMDRSVRLNAEDMDLRVLRASYLMAAQRYEAAIPDLKFVMQEDPDDADAPRLLALCYNNTAYALYQADQQLEEALEMIEEAITLDPEYTFWLSTKAEVLYALERYEEALPLIQRALEDSPDHPEMLEDLQRITAALQR